MDVVLNNIRIQHGDDTVIREFIGTPEYLEHIQDGTAALYFIDALYKYAKNNPDGLSMLKNAVRLDNRDKQHSIAWLRVFRTALVDNETDIVETLIREIAWPVDMLADVLETDAVEPGRIFPSGNELVSHPYVDRKAYMVALDDIKLRDPAFFEDYMIYRLITCASPTDLLASMIALDEPEYLFYVVDRDDVYKVPFDVRMLQEYIIWKYEVKETPNPDKDAVTIMAFLGRYEHKYAMNVFQSILYSNIQPLVIVMNQTDDARKEVRTREPENRRSILTAKGITVSHRGKILTRKDVDDLVKAIRSRTDIIESVKDVFVSAIEGRFMYL